MDIIDTLRAYAAQYNDNKYFAEDPIIFPKHFSNLQDIEVAAVISAHLAWGRRSMIVRDCRRAMDEMGWQPYRYIMEREHFKDDDCSLHRTVKWCEFARICSNLRSFYQKNDSLESLSPDEMRVLIFGQKNEPNAANKKIHMMRRWMVRDDGKVDLGVWKNTNKDDLIIPLDVHVHRSAMNFGITSRKSTDYKTALEITRFLKDVFPGDPTLGDFALFGAAVNGIIV